MDVHTNMDAMQCIQQQVMKNWGSPEARESVLQKVRNSKGFTVEVL